MNVAKIKKTLIHVAFWLDLSITNRGILAMKEDLLFNTHVLKFAQFDGFHFLSFSDIYIYIAIYITHI